MNKAINLAITLALSSSAALAQGTAPVPVAPEQSQKIETPRDVQKETAPKDKAPENKVEKSAPEAQAPLK